MLVSSAMLHLAHVLIALIARSLPDDGNQEKETKEERKKRRKTRWGGSEHDKTFIPGMPTVLPTNLTPEQEKAYLCKFLPST